MSGTNGRGVGKKKKKTDWKKKTACNGHFRYLSNSNMSNQKSKKKKKKKNKHVY